jgi:serine protease inhibitor
MPAFKFKTSYDLVPQCKALGIKDAFLRGVANFTGIGGPKAILFLGRVADPSGS